MDLEALWPLFGLRLRTLELELRLPNDVDIAALAMLAARGIHPPEFMPFAIAWTDAESPLLERRTMQYHWKCRAELSPNDWNLGFVVVADGEVVGSQSLHAQNFPTLRTVETGSWLGKEFQGRGIGKHMRAAVVRFAFDYLGAETITSGAYVDNFASHQVSLATGYKPNGVQTVLRRGHPAEQTRYRLTRARWEATHPDSSLVVDGFDACRSTLGLD